MATPAVENNNPGNLKDPSTGTFQKFNSPQEGYAALLNDLETKKSGKSTTGLTPTSTLAQFSQTYAPASDKNNPGQYTANLANHMGVRPDTQLKDLDTAKWAAAVAHNEDNSTPFGSGQTVTSKNFDVTSTPPDSNPLGVQSAEASTGKESDHNESVLGKLIDFAFPIVNDFSGEGAKKPLLQKAGDLGQSALWFVPGLGEGAEAAIKGAGLLGKVGARVAGHTLGGVATGYTSDVASKLSSGDTDVKDILTPGTGTLAGGALGGLLGKVGSKYTKSGVLDSLSKSNNDVIGQTKRGANELAESFSEDKNPGALLSQKGINIAQSVNPETVAFDTASHAQGLRDDANTLTDTLTKALERVPGSIQASDLENQLVNRISSQASDKITASEQAQMIRDEFTKIRAQYGEDLSAADMNELKKRAWNLSKFDMATPNLVRKTQRLIGNNLKTSVEEIAKKNGLGDVSKMNEYIGQHLDAADHLDRLHGTKAKGGRLGDILKSHALAEVGGVAGLFGGGPVGALMGALAGHYGGKVVGSGIRKTASSPIKSAILKRIVQEDPDFVTKIAQFAGQTPEALEKLKAQLGSQGIKIFKDTAKKVKTPPKSPGMFSKAFKGSAKSGLIGTASRVGSQFNSQNP